ncbi:ABC transporter, solute-binding protein [Marvinbryantia formatexigens DSM 14469]|uniref:ABC transporter, solute-binding protein n=1 Tax=Marvinbryantia formatexigens DSM 14469 TaxID=478749 RepID=C6LM58_9FIRM|nr:sugar ABC transporter substrate-binding protein [Marvinbryantia formatexigens]EET58273.1 ABC transporter, solute-binding protein [Marvinbryantia formatexigens DSM 14469]UWO23645.1 sugar ABC transporter substrate-binding protein [Marvinbryantia formatexigens DSM 14469]SDF64238.1 multiple sugar transport system substrate-binding protein [Marvinbryantia formatexigens]
MNFKKTAALLLTGAMIIGAVPVYAEEGGSDVTLSVSIWDSYQEPGIKEILAGFTEKTGIKTELSVIKWDEYWTMLEAGAQGGSLPDVFWMHSNESERYMSNDMLLDLTDKIAESDAIDPANYPEDIWGLYTYNDKYYAVPKDVDTIALWYNKTMFDEAGLDYPTTDWTWDDMFEAAKKLTKEDGSQYGLAIRSDNNQAGYYNLVYDNGGYIISDDKTKSGWDDEKTIEAMQQLEEWINAGVMPSLETMSENGEDVLFQSGKVAMVLQGSWMLAAYKENEYTSANCDVIELPKSAETGRRVSVYNGLGWAASASGEHTEEAWQLIEYLGSEDAQKQQAELGVTMSAYTGTSDAWVNSAPQFNLQAYLNMMEDMEIRPYSRSTVAWENENAEILKGVYTGELTMEEACRQMAEQMNEKLAEE